jgi:hypothetical protein
MSENPSAQVRGAFDVFSALDRLVLLDDIHPTLTDVERALAPLAGVPS